MNKPDIFNQSGLSREEFLRDYWQKKPVVLRRAVRQSDLAFLPDKNDLQKLAEHEDVQSRLVITEPTATGKTRYQVEYGPFSAEDWRHLSSVPWTLLVSDVEKWQPSHRRLLNYFPIIRRWLFDDLMFSYATCGGSVGAHTDHYDVFLLQTAGTRQWSYGQHPDPDAPLQTSSELKLLRDFQPENTAVLTAGDILYLPAEVPHHGIALDDECITCSVGLRAPAESELLSGYFEDLAATLPEHRRFSPTPQESATSHPGEITSEDVQQLRMTLERHLALDDTQLANWLGRFITQYRNLFFEITPPESTTASLEQARHGIQPDPFSRMAWRQLKNDGEAELFVNGQVYSCSHTLAQALCDEQRVNRDHLLSLDSRDRQVLEQLLESGEIQAK